MPGPILTGGQSNGTGNVVTLTFSKLTGALKSGVFTVAFNSSGGTTTGLLYVTQNTASHGTHAKAAKKKKKSKQVLIGSGKVTTQSAGPATLKINLTKAAKKKYKGVHNLAATLQLKTVNAGGQSSPTVSKKVKLK